MDYISIFNQLLCKQEPIKRKFHFGNCSIDAFFAYFM